MWKKRINRQERNNLAAKLSRTFDLPVDVMEGLPEIELLGNREAFIEHCQGVLAYNDQLVKLNTGRLIVQFTGRNLQMKSMTGDSVVVEGYFTSIEFIR